MPRGVFLELVIWEDFLDALSATRLQDEYNRVIRECDLFVMLFHTKVGKYTEEEFEAAVGQFQTTRKPFIFTYYKAAAAPAGRTVNAADTASLVAFQAKLKAMGHYQTVYNSVAELNLHCCLTTRRKLCSAWHASKVPSSCSMAWTSAVTTRAASAYAPL